MTKIKKEVESISERLLLACANNDVSALQKVGTEWMRLCGYSEDFAPTVLFDIKTQPMDIEISVTFSIADHIAKRSSNHNLIIFKDKENAIHEKGLELLVGLNSAIAAADFALKKYMGFPTYINEYNNALYKLVKYL